MAKERSPKAVLFGGCNFTEIVYCNAKSAFILCSCGSTKIHDFRHNIIFQENITYCLLAYDEVLYYVYSLGRGHKLDYLGDANSLAAGRIHQFLEMNVVFTGDYPH